MIEAVALAVCGILVGLHLWTQGKRLAEAERRYEELTVNLLKYGQPSKPTATVYDPGPVDDETRAQFEMRTRAVDRLSEYLADEGKVSGHRAREEAERLIAAFESRGMPE